MISMFGWTGAPQKGSHTRQRMSDCRQHFLACGQWWDQGTNSQGQDQGQGI